MNTSTTPLAARMRPRTLDEIVGQPHLLGADAPLRVSLRRGVLPSLLLWGPPGSGKTTLARLVAEQVGLPFLPLSAVMDGIKDLREVVARAGEHRARTGQGVVLFVDEIHRWNKAQQDALLPHVEEGLVVLVGATTENPGFEINPALRSRCWLLQLRSLGEDELRQLLLTALQDADRGLGALELRITPAVLSALTDAAGGDARKALSLLERLAARVAPGEEIDVDAAAEVLGGPSLQVTQDERYDVLSAFIKSMRGSDPDAALYWLARLLESGEDPMVPARRMVVFAAEDVGNAEPRALQLAVAAAEATHLIGMPEARIPLAQAAVFLATSPKSNASYKGINDAIALVRRTGSLPVPAHLRNAPTSLAKAMGHGKDYLYPHDHPDAIVAQTYLPEPILGQRLYVPTERGQEKLVGERLAWWARRRGGR